MLGSWLRGLYNAHQTSTTSGSFMFGLLLTQHQMSNNSRVDTKHGVSIQSAIEVL